MSGAALSRSALDVARIPVRFRTALEDVRAVAGDHARVAHEHVHGKGAGGGGGENIQSGDRDGTTEPHNYSITRTRKPKP